MTPNNKTNFLTQPSSTCMAIVAATNEKWESIDFNDIQQIYDRALTDNDVQWILSCIDASKCIKSLKFTHCFGITGLGLVPLRGSTVLERIDLSLVGDHEDPSINPEPPISADVVVPILDSIISTEGNSLVHVQLPKKWRQERSDILTQFLERFDSELNSRKIRCSKLGQTYRCEEICQGKEYYSLVTSTEGDYGMISFSCYQCKKSFCGNCSDYYSVLHRCDNCEKVYCEECNMVEYCDGGCSEQPRSCRACNVVKCW